MRHRYKLYYSNGTSEIGTGLSDRIGLYPKIADAHVVIDLTTGYIIKNRWATKDEAIKFICSLKSKYVRRIFKKRFLKLYGGS